MLNFFLKRLIWMAATLLAVYSVSFFLMRAVPGGPFDAEKKVPESIKRSLEARFGLDKPIHQQYLTHLTNIIGIHFHPHFRFQPDFGPSYRIEDMTVNEIIAQGLPISAALGTFAMIFAVTLGTTAGVVSAARRYSKADTSLMVVAMVGISVPNFVLASLVVMLFVFTFHLLPAGGWGTLQQLVLPSLCLGAPFAAYLARLTRTGMLEVLGQDFIRTARAKGLGDFAVVMRHALKIGLLPAVSYLGPAMAGVLTGSLVIERQFGIPGMGTHFIDAAFQRDYTLAMGVILVYTLLLQVLTLFVDFSYTLLDPRVSYD